MSSRIVPIRPLPDPATDAVFARVRVLSSPGTPDSPDDAAWVSAHRVLSSETETWIEVSAQREQRVGKRRRFSRLARGSRLS